MAEDTTNEVRRPPSVTVDDQGWLQTATPAFLRLIDRPIDALAGVNLIDLIHPLDAPDARRLLADATAERETISADLRMFVAGEQWQLQHLTARGVGDDRITVDVTSVEEAPSLVEAPLLAAERPTQPDIPEFTALEHAAHELKAPGVASSDSALLAHEASPRTTTNTTSLTYLALVPGPEVPMQRAAIRSRAGSARAPMIEIDRSGRTVFSSGDWASITGSDITGDQAFEEVLLESGRGDEIAQAMSDAQDAHIASNFELEVRNTQRWVHVLPIPSPERTDHTHALIAITTSADLADVEVTPVEPPPVNSTQVPPAAIEALGRITGTSTPSDTTPANAVADSGAATNSDTDHAATEATTTADAATLDGAEPHSSRSTLLMGLLVLAGVIFAGAFFLNSGSNDPVQTEVADFIDVFNTPDAQPLPAGGPIAFDAIEAETTEVTASQLWRPVGVVGLTTVHALAATSDGAVVADTAGRIVRLDEEGVVLSVISTGGGAGSDITDIAVDAQGTIWVLDAGNGAIYAVAPNDLAEPLITITDPLRSARGLGVGIDGSLWVASTASGQLTNVDVDGTPLGAIPLRDRQPTDVYQNTDGTFWVVDAQDHELIHVDMTGALLSATPLSPFGSVESPHLAQAGAELWITEPELSSVAIFDMVSQTMADAKVGLTRPDGVPLSKAIGIAIGTDGRVVVTDSNAQALAIYNPFQ